MDQQRQSMRIGRRGEREGRLTTDPLAQGGQGIKSFR